MWKREDLSSQKILKYTFVSRSTGHILTFFKNILNNFWLLYIWFIMKSDILNSMLFVKIRSYFNINLMLHNSIFHLAVFKW